MWQKYFQFLYFWIRVTIQYLERSLPCISMGCNNENARKFTSLLFPRFSCYKFPKFQVRSCSCRLFNCHERWKKCFCSSCWYLVCFSEVLTLLNAWSKWPKQLLMGSCDLFFTDADADEFPYCFGCPYEFSVATHDRKTATIASWHQLESGQVVSKTPNSVTGNEVTRNRVTGFIFFFCFFFSICCCWLCLSVFLFCCLFFSSEKKIVYIIRIWRVPPFSQIFRIPKETFHRRTFSRFSEVGWRSLWFYLNV